MLHVWKTYIGGHLIACSIKECFDQQGYKVYSNLECVLVKAVKKEIYDEGLKYLVDFHKDDYNHDQLKMQLGVLSHMNQLKI